MTVVKELADLLKSADAVKRFAELPSQMADLIKRMEALEARFSKAPGEVCPKCGEHGMRLTRAGRVMGGAKDAHRNEDWACEKCGHEEERIARV